MIIQCTCLLLRQHVQSVQKNDLDSGHGLPLSYITWKLLQILPPQESPCSHYQPHTNTNTTLPAVVAVATVS